MLEGLGLNDKGVKKKKNHGVKKIDNQDINKRINSARSSKIQKEMQFLSQLKEMEETMSHHGFVKMHKDKSKSKAKK